MIPLCPVCHTLFDDGYVTIHPEYRFFVFSRARESGNVFFRFDYSFLHTSELEGIKWEYIEYHLQNEFLKELGKMSWD